MDIPNEMEATTNTMINVNVSQTYVCQAPSVCPSNNNGDEVADLNIVSATLMALFSLVAVGIMCTALGAMGVCTNSINLAVYIRQGLTDGTTITLTALAFSDFLISTLNTFLGLCFLLDFLSVGQGRINWLHVMELVFAWPRSMASDFSVGITVFISAERAMCVTWPLKVGKIITWKRSMCVVILVYICISGCYLPLWISAGLSWQNVTVDDSALKLPNATQVTVRLQLWHAPNRLAVEQGMMGYNTVYRTLCFTLVFIFTVVMVSGLRAASRFRNRAAGSSNTDQKCAETGDQNSNIETKNKPELSTRDRRAVRVVSIVATMFIACMFPVIVAMMCRFIEPEIGTGGEQQNLLWVLFSIVYFSEAICASCNMFVYLRSSSRYRQTFQMMFGVVKD